MSLHSEEYKETKDGAITYFENNEESEVIKLYENSSNFDIKNKITVLIKQKDKNEQVFVQSLNEFEAIKEKVEANINKENGDKVEENENSNGDKEIIVTKKDEVEISSTEVTKDIKNDVKELEKSAEKIEELATQLKEDTMSVNMCASSLMQESVIGNIMLQEKMEYENAKNELKIVTATYMIEKNVLIAKREAIILQIKLAIQREEDVSGLSNELRNIENTITEKDSIFNKRFSVLQNDVSKKYFSLENAKKEVSNKVQADFKNSYKTIRKYNADGILTNEAVDLTKNLNRIVHTAEYNANILSDGKEKSITNETININGQIARIVTTEHTGGVEHTFLDGNTEQFTTNAGNKQTVTKDSDGDLIADNPELEDSLKKLGIENVDDIDEACQKIDEKTEKNEIEDREDDEYTPSLNVEDSE